MLDYVRKAHDIEIRPSSVASITSEPIARISFKFWLLVTLGHMPGSFFIFFFSILEKKCGIFYKYFSISLRWDPMGVRLLLPLQIAAESFQTSEFSSQWSSQSCIFEILEIEIKRFFFR